MLFRVPYPSSYCSTTLWPLHPPLLPSIRTEQQRKLEHQASKQAGNSEVTCSNIKKREEQFTTTDSLLVAAIRTLTRHLLLMSTVAHYPSKPAFTEMSEIVAKSQCLIAEFVS